MTFAPGSLVTARGRDWVVLPDSTDEMVMVRPLGGTDDETTGILAAVEDVSAASFDLPDPSRHLGDAHSARLLRDALRLGFRSGAGPFRSVAQLAVDPRPYQLVPLLMALRLDPVRLLIADDVGVGKTIEAALVAAELMAQGDADRLAVLCPPHLAEQWQVELADKFHIETELVLASTANRLERGLAVGQSIYDRYPNVIVSLDFIKSDRYRGEFIRNCPDLVIVDEAHTCAQAGERAASSRHQRHALVRDLAAKTERHLILVTATPHSGKDDSFRSLLSLLDGEFADLPHDLAGEHNRRHRERLARHLVQRRRSDIDNYLDIDTHFPERADREQHYDLSPDYRALFDDVLEYARSSVVQQGTGQRGQRIRWWSALGLLRALASSPAAAAATLRTRAVTVDAKGDSIEDIDELGRRMILDLDDVEEAPDVVPGSQTEAAESAVSRRLREFAKRADEIATGAKGADAKLEGLVGMVSELLADGFQPIVFCRFIETAEYVAERLRARLPKRDCPEVAAVTGRLPPSDREARVTELANHPRRVLVATDCLSEGVNLQDNFSAVIHYDLPWNPTRLEQREGRVDRYGQQQPEVRVVTYWGADNRIDETVLEVLLRKHRRIRGALGVSIPVPGSTNDIIEALAEQVLTSSGRAIDVPLQGIIEQLRPKTDALDAEWERARNNEVRRRSLFAQSRIDPSEVADELIAMREAIGSGTDVERFMTAALRSYGAAITEDAVDSGRTFEVDLAEVPDAAKDALALRGINSSLLVLGFGQAAPKGGVVLSRTHPAVGGLASHVLDQALDSAGQTGGDGPRVAARCGVMRTGAVSIITTLLLCRVRMSIAASARGGEHHMLAEEAMLLAFAGAPQRPDWLLPEQVQPLLDAEPVGNVMPEVAVERIMAIIDAEPYWRPRVAAEAEARAAALAEAHARVRDSDRRQGAVVRGPGPGRVAVDAQTPTDVLAVYHFLPKAVS
ncbi:helicase-related protein [Candidatus Poriferisocius sp.]|uniref:helicase-related protein n=1 Tax=Candidatus Poriferisocius sp. TaxID=3101276 RepID=UPI003B5C7683